ncbi:MAG: M20 family metallopeptidase [Anaerolineales bacterium]|jgi:amidohydrolase
MDLNLLKERARKTIKENNEQFVQLALEILDNPELGYQEYKSSQALVNVLMGAGFKITKPYGGLETAFKAEVSHGKGPNIFFLAEYDALPGVGHGCGHNLIGTAAVAAAIGAAQALPEVGGTIGVIGTPAEEYNGVEEGKIKLLKAGAFRNVSAALMLHPSYTRQVMGRDLGFIACEFKFFGKPAHAAADPWNGLNALDGLLATFNNINALRQQIQPHVRIHGVITEGGQAPNIIPNYTEAQFMVRAEDPKTLEQVYIRVCECAQAGALSSGTRLEINKITTVYNTRINPTLNRLIENNYEEIGMPITASPYQMDASSDFGNVSQEIPAAMFMLESHPQGIPWHSVEVAQASGEEKALTAMINGACVMAGVALDLLADGKLLSQVREDFKNV